MVDLYIPRYSTVNIFADNGPIAPYKKTKDGH